MRILLAALFLLLLSAVGAEAQTCTTSVSNVDFGTVNMTDGLAKDVTGTLTSSCTGMTAAQQIAVCISFNAGSGGSSGSTRTMAGPGGATVLYNLYSDAARNVTWGSSSNATFGPAHKIKVTETGGGAGTLSTTVYGRIQSGQAAAVVGSYSSGFSGGGATADYYNSPNCNTTPIQTESLGFSVLTVVGEHCQVSVANLDFGSKGLLDASLDGSSLMTLRCTSNLAYTVELNGGLANAAPGALRMTKGAENLTYGLFRDAGRSQIWGGTGQHASGTGTGFNQSLTVYGRVPAQTTPSPGLYSDTVVATVTY